MGQPTSSLSVRRSCMRHSVRGQREEEIAHPMPSLKRGWEHNLSHLNDQADIRSWSSNN